MSRLIPDDLKAQMIRNAYDVMEERADDHPPVVKLFIGNATWLLSEIDPFYDDIAFGLCDLGMGYPELGNVSISELEAARHPTLNIPVERDEHFVPSYPMSVYTEAARMSQQITTDREKMAIAQLTLMNRPK
ncbi:DUF2958 domain-containing protein [Dyadobacter sp. CY323]|uniref:DUF2958 domain-containing protein n=1 Tax=Dyadobacter sp. CY323 TaxID=2907302 RepID=UPI001F4048B0|nr:DUF2958 domain-containing protein [Dyadobacter sp. CY323]MCE6993116.1 DUF2958 domain-containing protein [Dyadobacter sp. CY323]